MVKIRLQREGAKKRPFYRIIAIDERLKRDGRALEFLGTYDPGPNPAEVHVRLDRVQAWVENGARMSESVRSLVRRAQAAGQATPGAGEAS